MVTAKRSKVENVETPRTLRAAHDLMGELRPASDASLSDWHAFYTRSASIYTEVAEIDRGHHHEALYWATSKRQRAEHFAERIATEKKTKDGAADPE